MADLIVVHGNPGSGKTTHCESLSHSGLNNQEFRHFSIGNRLRDIRTGRACSLFTTIINDANAPSPLDDDTVNNAMFEQIPPDNNPPIITLIDGYPRHPGAVDIFMDTMRSLNHRLLGVLALQIPIEVCVERILSRGQREGEDIKADTLRNFAAQRYEQDIRTTNRAIDLLSQFAIVKTIDASQGKKDVSTKFCAAIQELNAHR